MLYSVGHTGGLTLEDFPPPLHHSAFHSKGLQFNAHTFKHVAKKEVKQERGEKESMNEKEEKETLPRSESLNMRCNQMKL